MSAESRITADQNRPSWFDHTGWASHMTNDVRRDVSEVCVKQRIDGRGARPYKTRSVPTANSTLLLLLSVGLSVFLFLSLLGYVKIMNIFSWNLWSAWSTEEAIQFLQWSGFLWIMLF